MKTKPKAAAPAKMRTLQDMNQEIMLKILLYKVEQHESTIKRLEGRLSESRTREILLLEQHLEKDTLIENLLAELHACQDDQK